MMQKYRFACRTWLSCTGKFTDAALLNEQMYNLHEHDNDDERLEIHMNMKMNMKKMLKCSETSKMPLMMMS